MVRKKSMSRKNSLLFIVGFERELAMKSYDVAAYIWPSYHYEPRLEHFWPEKDGEWYTVRRGTPRFPGHDMPKVPLLGYQDEADPRVMRQHIELGRAYGVNTFIMDWYWYENQPCLERQLNEGLIPALDGTDSKFYIMWANHDANTAWDMHTDEQSLLWSGQVDRAAFETAMQRVIDRCFGLNTYYRIDKNPVFCVYLLPNLIAGLGGLKATAQALNWFRERTVASGHPGLHLQAIMMNGCPVDVADSAPDINGMPVREQIIALSFDSVSHYQYVHIAGSKGDYTSWADKGIAEWDVHAHEFPMYFPHVSVGWDNTQRFPSAREIVTGSDPDKFERYLRKAKDYLDARPHQPPLVTVNSWNEWTEGSYLLPDKRWGYRYLQAICNVFGAR
jgi:hypothetical protein